MIRFGNRGKLSPRFIGPFEVLERLGEVAYRLTLPLSLEGVHDVFHISQLRRYVRDDNNHVLDHTELELRPDLSYTKKPMAILDRTTKERSRSSHLFWCLGAGDLREKRRGSERTLFAIAILTYFMAFGNFFLPLEFKFRGRNFLIRWVECNTLIFMPKKK